MILWRLGEQVIFSLAHLYVNIGLYLHWQNYKKGLKKILMIF